MIRAMGLTKSYGEKVVVDDLSFEVNPGTFTGFIGPNGAGKSTTMRMLIGLDHPDAGTATISGLPYPDLKDPMREVGVLIEAKAFHATRTARNHLRMLAAAGDISRARIDEVLEMVGLTGEADRSPPVTPWAWPNASGWLWPSSEIRGFSSSTSRQMDLTQKGSPGCATCCARWPMMAAACSSRATCSPSWHRWPTR